MKKLLLLSILTVFAQIRSEFPEMTEAQQKELEGIKHIIPSYLSLVRLKMMNSRGIVEGETRQTSSTCDWKGNIIETKKLTFDRDGMRVTFHDEEVDSYDALTRMLTKDCVGTSMFTDKLNPSNVKACAALRDMLTVAGCPEDDFGFAVLKNVMNRSVNK